MPEWTASGSVVSVLNYVYIFEKLSETQQEIPASTASQQPHNAALETSLRSESSKRKSVSPSGNAHKKVKTIIDTLSDDSDLEDFIQLTKTFYTTQKEKETIRKPYHWLTLEVSFCNSLDYGFL